MTLNINNSPENKTFYYVNRQGEIRTDNDLSRLGSLRRRIFAFGRDYNLFHVHQRINENTSDEIKKEISLLTAKKCGMSQEDYKALEELSNRKDDGTISQFLQQAESDASLNRKLNTLIKKTNGLATVSLEVLQDVAAYSYKIRQKEEMIRIANKADTVYQAFESGQAVAEDDKLTISEVRTLESLAKMQPIFDRWSHIQGENRAVWAEISQKCTRSKEIVDGLVSQAERDAPIQAGTFILYDMDTDFALRGQRVSWIQRFIFEKLLGTNISHVSVAYNNTENQQIEAHMWGSPESRFTQGRRTLGNHCFKTFYIAPEHLVPENDHNKMRELYGDNWGVVLQEKFTAIAREYYTEDRLRELKNPPLRRALAAIGFRFSLFRKSWQERAQFPSNNEVICSEFALLSTLQCLDRLNREIELDYQNEKGNTVEVINSIPELSPPIRENRRLNRVIPSDLIERTVRLNVATVGNQANCIRAVIKCADRLLY